MKKQYKLALFLSLLSTYSFSQGFYSARRERSLIFVGGMGLSTYFGDLKDGNSFDTKPTLNVGLSHYLSEHVNARVDATWFRLQGDDAKSGEPLKVKRNLSFLSDNFEISATLAYSIFSNGSRYYRRPSLNIYAFTGIGVCYFNPTTVYKGKTISLPALKTEGVDYSTFTPVIPIGLGLRIKVAREFNLSFEGGYRMTFTDYIDDVSSYKYPDLNTLSPDAVPLSFRSREVDPDAFIAEYSVRGNPKSNDSYFLLNVKLEYYLPKDFIFGNNSGHYRAQAYKRKKSNYRRAKNR